MSTPSYITQPDCRAAINQLNNISDFVLKFYPGEIGKGNQKQGETVSEVIVRLLSPTETVNDTNAKVPNWAVDTLAKKELRRLAQYVLNNFPQRIQEGGVVDTVIGMLEASYLPNQSSNCSP